MVHIPRNALKNYNSTKIIYEIKNKPNQTSKLTETKKNWFTDKISRIWNKFFKLNLTHSNTKACLQNANNELEKLKKTNKQPDLLEHMKLVDDLKYMKKDEYLGQPLRKNDYGLPIDTKYTKTHVEYINLKEKITKNGYFKNNFLIKKLFNNQELNPTEEKTVKDSLENITIKEINKLSESLKTILYPYLSKSFYLNEIMCLKKDNTEIIKSKDPNVELIIEDCICYKTIEEIKNEHAESGNFFIYLSNKTNTNKETYRIMRKLDFENLEPKICPYTRNAITSLDHKFTYELMQKFIF